MENGVLEIARRDTSEKASVKIEDAGAYILNLLSEIQDNLLNTSKSRTEENIVHANSRDEFTAAIAENKFVMAHRDGTTETEETIQQETKATIRCIPLDSKLEE